MAYGTLAMAAAFLPLALYSVEKRYSSEKIRYMWLLPLSLAISFFSGHFQTSLYVAFFTAAYILFKIVIVKKKINVHLFTICLFVLGIVISLIQIVPTMRLYQVSVRSDTVHAGGGIAWDHLITLVAPDFFGNPVTRNDWVGSYAEWAMFIGIIPLTFLVLSFFHQRKQYISFFFILGITTLIFSLETPLHMLLILSRIPVLATSIPSRMIILASFSFAVLSSFGVDYVLKEGIKKRIFF
jgi:uncharacterized membrane protein YfhO